MIAGCVKVGAPIQTLEVFKKMKAEGETHPCADLIVAALSGCADIGVLEFGQCIHGC